MVYVLGFDRLRHALSACAVKAVVTEMQGEWDPRRSPGRGRTVGVVKQSNP